MDRTALNRRDDVNCSDETYRVHCMLRSGNPMRVRTVAGWRQAMLRSRQALRARI